MSKRKITQGEWKFTVENGRYFKIISEDGILVAEVDSVVSPDKYDYATPEGALANTKLICMAPEMLEVLETIENDSNQVPEWLWERIQSVIRKAVS